MIKLVLSLVLLVALYQQVSSERILAIVTIPSYSHQVFYQQLWREFAIRGHEIVVITTDPTNETLSNFREISIRESYGPMKKLMKQFMNTNMYKIILDDTWNHITLSIAEFQLQLPQVQELINNKSEHFDLLMIEHFYVTPTFGFQHRFNCSMIGVMSMDGLDIAHEMMGNSAHSILYPSQYVPYGVISTYLQRFMATYFATVFRYHQYGNTPKIDQIARKHFGQDMPSVQDIFERTDMLFVNDNPVFSAIRPHTPSTISIAGGIHMKPAKPLTQELKEYLDNAKEGVIYLSLGSNMKSNNLKKELLQTILETFAQVPYKVLWKFESDSLPGKPANVKIIQWAPQQDILRHENVKLFITQGGLQSLEESLYSHVPIVVMPFFGDQFSNAVKAQNKGLGLAVNKDNLSVAEFKAAILEVMTNPSYSKIVKQIAIQIQDKSMTALERAIWWTEYVLRHKHTQHLKGPRIPLYQYYYLDLFAGGVIVILFVLAVLFFVVKLLIKCFWFLHAECTAKKANLVKLKNN